MTKTSIGSKLIVFMALIVGIPAVTHAQSELDEGAVKWSFLRNGANPIFQGKKVLVTNIATNGTHAKQLDDLLVLAAQTKALDFVIIAIPSNDFGNLPGGVQTLQKMEQGADTKHVFITNEMRFNGTEANSILGKLSARNFPSQLKFEVKSDFQKFIFSERGELIAVFQAIVPYSSEPVRKVLLLK